MSAMTLWRKPADLDNLTEETSKEWNDLPIEERMGCACCSNPNHVTDTDDRGNWIYRCTNCGAHC